MIVKRRTGTDSKMFYMHNKYIFHLRLFCILFGAIGLIIGGLMVRRYWTDRQKRIEDEKRKQQLEFNRRDRRSRVRDEDLPENQICVVCKVNPREVNIRSNNFAFLSS